MNEVLTKSPELGSVARVGVLLPYRLTGAYDYRAAEGADLPRGSLVIAPLGPREVLGVVWNTGDGKVVESKLKTIEPLEGAPRLPAKLCDFIDWVAEYKLTAPGMVLAMALRSAQAFEPETMRVAYVKGETTPARMTPSRMRVLEIAGDGLARSVPALAQEADASAAVVRGLIAAGALVETELPEFPRFSCPEADFETTLLSEQQAEASEALRAAVRDGRFCTSLLDGVTGSGKTEVYFEAIAEALKASKQTLILLPEIALTVQFLERFAVRFGCRPAEWHSDL